MRLMSEIKEKEISVGKTYHFPPDIHEINHKGKTIIVSPLTANWIVLDNDNQLEFLRLLKHNSIGEALDKFRGNESDASWVVTQLEARNFERSEVRLKDEISSAHIYVTNGCNMLCPHCYMYAGDKEDNELSATEILKAIDSLLDAGVTFFAFSGGEPLLNSNLIEFAQRASSRGAQVQIMSNGTLWTEDFIERISPYITSVQISIDGFDEASNSQIRGKGNFKKALLTVDRLLNKDIKTSVAMAPKLSQHLRADIPNYVEFAKSLYAKYSKKQFSLNIVWDLWDGREIHLSDTEKEDLHAIVDEIFQGIFGSDGEDDSFILSHRKFKIENNCAYGNITISASGDVYFCSQIQILKPFGNLRTDSMEKILKKSEQAKLCSEVSHLSPCGKCPVRYICGGDCRIKYFTYLKDGILPPDGYLPKRVCTKEHRHSIYDLMIRTNEKIFQ